MKRKKRSGKEEWLIERRLEMRRGIRVCIHSLLSNIQTETNRYFSSERSLEYRKVLSGDGVMWVRMIRVVDRN